MPIGDMPILEIVIRQLKHAGITDIVLAVGSPGRADAGLLRRWFTPGGADRLLVARKRPLGTAGPLALIPGLDETFLVMNGDVLTTIDYTALIAAHRRSGALAHHRHAPPRRADRPGRDRDGRGGTPDRLHREAHLPLPSEHGHLRLRTGRAGVHPAGPAFRFPGPDPAPAGGR